MKTTKEIINNELGVILNSVDYDVNNALFEINKNKRWYSEEEILDSILATTIKSSRYGHEGYIDAELLKIALFKNHNPTNVGINKQEVDQNEESKS